MGGKVGKGGYREVGGKVGEAGCAADELGNKEGQKEGN